MIKKFCTKKTYGVIIAIIMCFTVTFASVAVSRVFSSTDILIKVNKTDTLEKTYTGFGANLWSGDLHPDGIKLNNFSEAYFEINAQRILKMKPKVVRYMISPHFLCYLDDADKGEARWKKGEMNFDSIYMYNFWRYLEVFEAAGTEVLINFGYAATDDIKDWFTIKDSPDRVGGIRSAPEDLDAFANAFNEFIKECDRRGFVENGTVKYVTFYNENDSTQTEYNCFGDERAYWCTMIEKIHNCLVASGYRYNGLDRSKNKILISGADLTTSGNMNVDILDDYYSYVYENLYQKGYCDTFNFHMYVQNHERIKNGQQSTLGKYDSKCLYATDQTEILNKLNAVYADKYGLNFIMAEVGAANEQSTIDGKKGVRTLFNGNAVSLLMSNARGGALTSLYWVLCGHKPLEPVSYNFSSELYPWEIPSIETDDTGIDKVNSSYGPVAMAMRYIPENSKVALSTTNLDPKTDSGNKYRTWTPDTVFATTFMNDNDTSIVVEVDTEINRNITVDLEGMTGTFYKYIYKFPDSDLVDSEEAKTQFDGNALFADGIKSSVATVEDGMIIDSVGKGHYAIIYSTIEPIKEIELKSVSLECKKGESVKVEVENIYNITGISNASDANNYNFEVYRGVTDTVKDSNGKNTYLLDLKNRNIRKGSINEDGVYTPDANAQVGDTVAVKVTVKNLQNNISGSEITREQIYNTDTYAIAVIKIVE